MKASNTRKKIQEMRNLISKGMLVIAAHLPEMRKRRARHVALANALLASPCPVYEIGANKMTIAYVLTSLVYIY